MFKVIIKLKNQDGLGTSLVVQWVRHWAYTAGDTGSIPSLGTKIPQATQHSQKIEEKKSYDGIKETGFSFPHKTNKQK